MNLLELVEQETGARFKWHSKKDGGEYVGPCPFCRTQNDPESDRFHVWPNHHHTPLWWCRGCSTSGGSIVLMKKLYGLTAGQAKDRLLEMGYPLDEQPYEPRRQAEKAKLPAPSKHDLTNFSFDVKTALAWHVQDAEKALDYFSQWGLTGEDIQRFMLGYSEEYNGYAIPHWWIDETDQYILKGIKFRHETTDPKRRFSTVPGSLTRGVFNPTWVSNPDGTRLGPTINYLFILEAEKDTMLIDGLGYPAIAFFPEEAWMQYLPVVLRNVIQPVIVYDEDGGKGLTRALTITEALRTRPLLVSTKTWNVKSPSDIAKEYGRKAVHEWIRSLNLDVEPNEYNRPT